VSSLFYDGGGILTAHNLNVGDPVSASYVVDFGAPGFYLLNDGSVDAPANPPLGNVHTTYFYCRWASGTLLPEANGGFNNKPQDIAEYFTGWNQSSPSGNEGLLQGGTGDSYFSARKSSLSSSGQVQDWQVGTEVSGVLVAWSDQDWSIAWADMRLDSITAVPEPSAIPLFSYGGAALLLWGRQRANHQSPGKAGRAPRLTSDHPLKIRADCQPFVAQLAREAVRRQRQEALKAEGWPHREDRLKSLELIESKLQTGL
jgi:hypothetical protein